MAAGCEDASWLVVISNNGFESTGPLLFIRIETGETSGYRQEDEAFYGEELVIRDAATWETLWRAHRPGYSPPRVDFEREMVLAAFMGPQNLGCEAAGVTIRSVNQERDRLAVEVEEARPAGGEECQSNPYDFVRCARSAAPVAFMHIAPEDGE